MIFDIILLLVVIAGFAVIIGIVWRSQKQALDSHQLQDMVSQVFGMSVQSIAEQSRNILQSEKEVIKVDLANKHQSIERMVNDLKQEMEKRQQEIRSLERDRTQKFSELVTSMEQHRLLTNELSVSTRQLATVLSNNQTRGQWGERIIEDLLTSNGLVEGVHYQLQHKLGNSQLRPDVILLLPNKRVVPVDVKFPYAEIQKMTTAESKAQKDQHQKQFSADLRKQIEKVSTYIDPSYDTLDYAIMFVPNEMIFSFINQKLPEVVDEAIAKRVIMVSPVTFLIVARTVMESYRNFMIGDQLKEIIKYINEFVSEWQRFKSKFEKYGRSLTTLQADYEELMSTRVRQMERRIEKVQTYHQGNLLNSTAPTPLSEVVSDID